MKYPKSGSTTMTGAGSTLDCLMAASGRRLLGAATQTAGRVFWLRQFGLYCLDNTTGAAVALVDATQGATGASATTNTVRIVVWGPTIGATGSLVTVDFKNPGLKFTTEAQIMLFGASTATGMWNAWGCGYEA